MEEPAAEPAKEKSNVGRVREVEGHVEDDAEHDPATAPIPLRLRYSRPPT